MTTLRGLFAPLLAFALVLTLEAAGAPALASSVPRGAAGGVVEEVARPVGTAPLARMGEIVDVVDCFGKYVEKHHTFHAAVQLIPVEVYSIVQVDYKSCASDTRSFIKLDEADYSATVKKGNFWVRQTNIRILLWDKFDTLRHPKMAVLVNDGGHASRQSGLSATPFLYYKGTAAPVWKAYMVLYLKDHPLVEWISAETRIG